MSEPRAGGYREPLAGESLDEYEAALAAAEDEVVAAIWRATLRGALGDATATPPGTEPTDAATPPGTEPTDAATPPGTEPTDSATTLSGPEPSDTPTPPGTDPADPPDSTTAGTGT